MCPCVCENEGRAPLHFGQMPVEHFLCRGKRMGGAEKAFLTTPVVVGVLQQRAALSVLFLVCSSREMTSASAEEKRRSSYWEKGQINSTLVWNCFMLHSRKGVKLKDLKGVCTHLYVHSVMH